MQTMLIPIGIDFLRKLALVTGRVFVFIISEGRITFDIKVKNSAWDREAIIYWATRYACNYIKQLLHGHHGKVIVTFMRQFSATQCTKLHEYTSDRRPHITRWVRRSSANIKLLRRQ